MGISTLLLKQRGVIAALHNPPILQHHDAVGVAGRGRWLEQRDPHEQHVTLTQWHWQCAPGKARRMAGDWARRADGS